MVTVLGVLAGAWGVVMATAPALQIRRMLARRSSQDISLGYFGILLPGFGLWIGYGIAGHDWALVVPNVVAFTVGVITIIVALSLRRTRGSGNRMATRSSASGDRGYAGRRQIDGGARRTGQNDDDADRRGGRQHPAAGTGRD